MRIKAISWVGTRTDGYPEMVAFFRDVLGMPVSTDRDDFALFVLPNGDRAELFGPASPWNRHFDTGPVAGFLVDDFDGPVAELEDAGVDIVHQGRDEPTGIACAHFRAPDGALYEIVRDPSYPESG